MTRYRWIVVGVTTALLCGAAVAQETAQPKPASTPAPTGDVENGKKLYKTTGCYECHGTAAQGSPRTGPMLLTPLPFPAFVRQLQRPRGEMPPYEEKVLSEQQAADIYAYIMTLPKPVDHKTIKLLQ